MIAGTGVGGLAHARGEQVDAVPREGPEPGQPVLRADDDAERDRRADRRCSSAGPGPTLCIATACAAGANAIGEGARLHPRRHRRRRGGRRHRGGVTPLTDRRVRPHGRAEHAQRRPRARVAAVRRRPRRLRDRRGRRRSSCSSRWSGPWPAGATIYGEVAGYGRNADAYHITAPSPGGAGAAACMQLALDDAGLDAGDIGHVNAHGTSTPLNDAAEAEAIRKVFGDASPPVTSTKGVHRAPDRRARARSRPSSRCWRCATASCRRPPTSTAIGDDIDARRRARRRRADRAPSPAISNSFGFGGHNASLVLAAVRVTAPVTPHSRRGAPQRHRDRAALVEAPTGARVELVPPRGRQAPRRDRRRRGRGARAGGTPRDRARRPGRRRARDVGRRRRTRASPSLHAWGRVARRWPTRRASCRRCSRSIGPVRVRARRCCSGSSTSRDDRPTRSRTSPAPTPSRAFTGDRPSTAERSAAPASTTAAAASPSLVVADDDEAATAMRCDAPRVPARQPPRRPAA